MMTPAIWTGMYIPQPLDEALRILHAQGWDAFEASTEHLEQIETDASPDARIEERIACLSELGLSMPQAHGLIYADVAASDRDKRQEDVRRLVVHIDIAARLGVRNVVIHPGGKFSTRAQRQAAIALNVEAFRRLGDIAGERGLWIGIENINRNFATSCDLLDLLDAIDHPAVGVTLDTSHTNVVGVDIPATIRELGHRIIATHISDNVGSGDQHLAPGNGNIDWPAAMEAFREIGYDGLLNLEIPGERHRLPPLRAAKSSHALQVAKWLVGLGG